MSKKKISVIFGTRPEAIKLAPVILALRREDWCECRVCVTGQHRQMLDQVLAVFQITPDVDLNLMAPSQTLGGLTARAMAALDGYLAEEKPDLVLVQGDTTTVFCAALAAFYHRIPIGHVEAGLRTGNMQSPWPEEANRVLTTRLAALHFAPTESNRVNLLKENVPDVDIVVTGNTVIDALLLGLEQVRRAPVSIAGLPTWLMAPDCRVPVVLVTGHRRENFGSGMESICHALAQLASHFPEMHYVYPVHLNPNVREPVQRILGSAGSDKVSGNVHLIEPLPYLSFIALMDRAKLILTDSGGVQEEAPSLGKPVLVMRDTTERPEAVLAGTVKLVGSSTEAIVRETTSLLVDDKRYQSMQRPYNPYGDGKAAARIILACRRYMNGMELLKT